MQQTVYEIINSFVAFEKLKKSRSFINLKQTKEKKTLNLSKSSIAFTSPLVSERVNDNKEISMDLMDKKRKLLAEIAKSQFKMIEIREKQKEKTNKVKTFKRIEENLQIQEKELFSEKQLKEVELKRIENSFSRKMPDFLMKKTHSEAIKQQLEEFRTVFDKNNKEMNEKIESLRAKLANIGNLNSELTEKLKTTLQEEGSFKKTHNVIEIKGKITRNEYELQSLQKQIEELEKNKEMEEKQRVETQKNLKGDILIKNSAMDQLKSSQTEKESNFKSELAHLSAKFKEQHEFTNSFKELIRKQKSDYLKDLKECDDQKLRLFREMSSKKEAYDDKYNKFIQLAKQKSIQIDFKRLSTTDIEVEEMRESKRMLKTTFESQMKQALVVRDELRTRNNGLNETLQAEMLKKTSWNMKLNRINDEKKTKNQKKSENQVGFEKLKNLKEKLSVQIKDLEANKIKQNKELEKLTKDNEELKKYWNSIGDLRAEIEEKKRERQWFNDIKKEIGSQKDSLVKKIKEIKKFGEKTQKELNSQKEDLVKFQAKIVKLEKTVEDLEKKNSEYS